MHLGEFKMLDIIKRKMAGGQLHEHIAEVEYKNASGEIKKASRAAMVEWLDKSKTNTAIVRAREDPSKFVYVGTVHPDHSPAFMRTFANGKWTDNLLSLPEYY